MSRLDGYCTLAFLLLLLAAVGSNVPLWARCAGALLVTVLAIAFAAEIAEEAV